MSARVYYNEIDPFAAAWLRELIAADLIAPGDVDERSIEDVLATDLVGYAQCHFFAGIGGWSYALRLAGWPDDRPVWTGSCPCQPFSAAGARRGFADRRHMWPHFRRLIGERRPATVFGEQVAGAPGYAWFDLVRADLELDGYACGAADLPAAGVGAPHIRQRLYWVAHAIDQGQQPGGAPTERTPWPVPGDRSESGGVVHADGAGLEGFAGHGRREAERRVPTGYAAEAGPPRRAGADDGPWGAVDWLWCADGRWRPIEPGLVPLVDGLPGRVAVLRGFGNAIVPPLAAAYIETVMDILETPPWTTP